LENGIRGCGEGIPRVYVTGETIEEAVRVTKEVHIPCLKRLNPSTFREAVRDAAGLETVVDRNRVYSSARCSVELALLDAYGIHFQNQLFETGHVLDGITFRGHSADKKYSAVLPGAGGLKTRLAFFLLSAGGGFREFKIKLGMPDDPGRWAFLQSLSEKIGKRAIRIRADANEAWTLPEALMNLERLSRLGIHSLEQPLKKDDHGGLKNLVKTKPPVRIVLDESLRSLDEAVDLARSLPNIGFNIRLSKNGGFTASLKMVQAARDNAVPYQLGSMVGETGILSTAQRHFIQAVPDITAIEPSFSTLLLKRDIIKKNVSFPVSSRIKPLRASTKGYGLGIKIHEKNFREHARCLLRCTL
jgi:muconate cycloisomerase